MNQSVVEQIERGEALQVVEGQAVHPLDLVLVQKQTVQGTEASECVLVDVPQTVSMQEQMAEIVKVHECVVLKELQMIILWSYKRLHKIKF